MNLNMQLICGLHTFIIKEMVKKKKKIISNNLLWSNKLVGGFYPKGLPWMGIDPFKSLYPKYSSLREAIPLKDERLLLLKLLLSKCSTSNLLNAEKLSKPVI